MTYSSAYGGEGDAQANGTDSAHIRPSNVGLSESLRLHGFGRLKLRCPAGRI